MEESWRAILDDPNSTQAMRDFALSQLNDSISLGRVAPEIIKSSLSNNDTVLENWKLVEDFELGILGNDDGNAVVRAAADAILDREGDDSREPIQLKAIIKNDGSHDILAAYPKLAKTCGGIIKDTHIEKEMKSNAYVVMSYLRGQMQGMNDIGGEVLDDLKKAIKLCPGDWRLHSMLATRNMAIYNTALALESISRALDLTTDDFARFCLGIRKGKIFFNLNRNDETIAAFREVISLYDGGLKDHPLVNDRVIGRLAVAEYMLVIIYGQKGDRKKAKYHYRDAEEKRNSINVDVARKIDWSNRMMAQLLISNMSPGIIGHGECHFCGEVTNSPKRCGACKAVFYCSKTCQVSAWKAGHKKECKKEKAEQNEKTAAVKQESTIRDERGSLPPLDVDLDPRSLWKEGVELSKSANYKEASWKFIVALFIDFSMDANDMGPVIDAVKACEEDDPVAMALSSISTHKSTMSQRAEEMYYRAIKMECNTPVVDLGGNVDEVDRPAFGLGMCFIIYARKLRQSFMRKLKSGTLNRDGFDDIARLVRNSSDYIDPQRWLTLQFELGYTSYDVCATIEAEKWLEKFTKTIDATNNLRSTPQSKQHWSNMRAMAVEKLERMPWLKMTVQHNPGIVRDGEL